VKALIVGGGIAGPVCAMALERAGIESAVYEAYDGDKSMAAGAYLTIAVNGISALRAIGAEQIVLDHGFPTASIEFTSVTGRYLGTAPIGPILPDGATTHSIKRADICRAVHHEAVRRGIDINYGKCLVAASTTSTGGVVASFADGSHAAGDLLIGADGVHSVVRTIIDPAAAAPRYNGFGSVGGFCAVPVVEGSPGACRMFYGTKCFFGYSMSPDGLPWWFANPPREREYTARESSGAASGEWQRRLIEDHALSGSPIADIIRATPGKLIVSNQYEIPHVRGWNNDAMVLIGDAAHAPSPASGQGASLAIEDAIFLAKCLRDTHDIPKALAVYTENRRSRAERVVMRGAKANQTKPRGVVQPIPPDDVLIRMIEYSARPDYWQSQAWLFNYSVGW
jgi:FAD-dependent urate hydroxylase